MALTYRRPHLAMVQRRSTRPSLPTEAARQSAEQQQGRRVHFTPTSPPSPPIVADPTLDSADPLAPTQEEPRGTPGFQSDKYALKGQLPQYFPHGLPPSSLEPGTSDLQFPPTTLFPEAPLGDGEILMRGTPL